MAEPSVSPSDDAIDRESYLKGIKEYEERLDETTFPIYTGWLTDVFGDASADLKGLPDTDLVEVWSRLGELVTEGAPA